MSRVMILAAATAVFVAGPVQGADLAAESGAERRLQQRLQFEPDDQVTLARLAGIYARSGRPAKARRLYRALMTLEDVALERTGGAAMSSRGLASAALRRLDADKPVRMGSR